MPASSVWRTIRGFILWSHERGTIQYDVMVTLILIFIFLSPRLMNFKDRPVERNSHSTSVLVSLDGSRGLVYQIDAKAVQSGDDAAIRSQFVQLIEPISGGIAITRYETVRDNKGRVTAYKVWAERE